MLSSTAIGPVRSQVVSDIGGGQFSSVELADLPLTLLRIQLALKNSLERVVFGNDCWIQRVFFDEDHPALKDGVEMLQRPAFNYPHGRKVGGVWGV